MKSLQALFTAPKVELTAAHVARWKANTEKFRSDLPPDFVSLQQHYGPGRFCGSYLRVHSPYAENYVRSVENGLDCARSLYTPGKTYTVHPETPGLFPWASDEDGCNYFWMTEGSPKDWPVFYELHGCDDYIRFDENMTTFLYRFFTNEYTELLKYEPFDESEYAFLPDSAGIQKA